MEESRQEGGFLIERILSRSACVVLLTSLAACGGNVLTHQTGVSDVTDMATVKADDDRGASHSCDGTLFVDWPEGTSASITEASKKGLVVVRVKGCKLEVLSACHADGAYDFVSVTPARDRTEVSADNAIAIGIMGKNDKRFGGEAGMGSSHAVEYAIVGQEMAKAAPTSMSGDCAGATHYVSGISVGAYELSSTEHSEVTAIIKLHEHQGAESHGAGDVDRCSKQSASTDESCKSPLKLDLSRAPLAK